MDLVYLAPEFLTLESSNKYDLIYGLSPPLIPALKHAYSMSKNIILSLPKKTDLTYIADIFY